MIDKIAFLQRVPIFAGLGVSQIETIARFTVTRRFPKNVTIFQEGDQADALYVLVNGKIKVMLSDEEGREVIVSILGEGEYFGEMALFGSGQRCARVEAMTGCEVLLIGKGDFNSWLGSQPEIAFAIIKELSRRLRKANRTISNLATLDVQGRVLRVLLDSAERQGEALVVEAPLTQRDLAAMVGASRERVNRAIRDLINEGMVRADGTKLILSPEVDYY